MNKDNNQNPPAEIPPQTIPNNNDKPLKDKDPLAPSETNPINPKAD